MLESLINHYCVFFQDHKLDYGWIEGIQKNKLIIVPLQGKIIFLPENRVAFSWRGKKLPLNAVQAHETIGQHLKQAEQYKQAFELETMHSLLENGREYSLDELAFDFLDDPKNSVYQLGLFLALREDSFWFKHNRNLTYTPRTSAELELLQVQLVRQHERRKRAVNIQKWIKHLESGAWNEDSEITAEQQIWLDQLLNLLADGTDSPHWKEMSSLLGWGTSIGPGEENSLKRWLAKAGAPVSASRLTLLRANVREQFTEEALSEVERVSNLPLENIERISAKVPTFTIDAEKTLDYDDAFSVLEWSEGELIVAIHITDLSHAIQPEDPLFKEAESRISSVYSPEGPVPMLPDLLSNDTFSLKAGEDRAVLSFKFQLTGNGDWNLLEVAPKIARVQKNLSYEQADLLIKGKQDFWGLLNKFCMKAFELRLRKGALNLTRKEFNFDISDPEQICITPLNRNSPANRIIEELAIAVNRETGRLFKAADFPGIYRTQASFELIKEVEDGEQLSLEHIQVEPARLTTISGTHAGLGCEAYMHTTSPIRRFADLITQLQLKMLIKEEDPVFSTEDMMHWAEEVSLRQRKYKRAEREIIQYWKLRYLQQHLGEIFAAKIRKGLPNNNTEIELIELDCTVPVFGLGVFEEGEHLLLRIDEVGLEPPRLGVHAQASGSEVSSQQLGNLK